MAKVTYTNEFNADHDYEEQSTDGFRLSYLIAMLAGMVLTLIALQHPALADDAESARTQAASLPAVSAPIRRDMRFTLINGERDNREVLVRADGLFSATTDVVFERFLMEHELSGVQSNVHRGRPIRIILNSTGGDLFASLRFGRMLREQGHRVAVQAGDDCLSACAFAFLGGHDRQAANGVLGLHSFALRVTKGDEVIFKPLSDNRAIIVQALLERYFSDMGIDRALLQTALDTPHDAMTYLSRDHLIRTGALMGPGSIVPSSDQDAWTLRMERL